MKRKAGDKGTAGEKGQRTIFPRVHALQVIDLAVAVEGKEIVHGATLQVRKGEIVALMGPNGSGKSTLANAIMGNPALTTIKGAILWKGKRLNSLPPDERSRRGIFLSFQYPAEVPGLSIESFLRTAYNSHRSDPVSVIDFHRILQEKMSRLSIDPSFMARSLNEGFSGGEKKRCEILQLAILEPEIAILDETDSGTDVDMLRVIGKGIMAVKKETGMGVLLITHYERILRYVMPDRVLIMKEGRIVRAGGLALAKAIEKSGYDF